MGETDTFVIRGDAWLIVDINISSSGSAVLTIRNESSTISSQSFSGPYGTTITPDGNYEGDYEVEVRADENTSYEMVIRGYDNMDDLTGVLEYGAIVCGSCVIVVVVIAALIYAIYRRKKPPQAYVPQQAPVPYSVEPDDVAGDEDEPYEIR